MRRDSENRTVMGFKMISGKYDQAVSVRNVRMLQ